MSSRYKLYEYIQNNPCVSILFYAIECSSPGVLQQLISDSTVLTSYLKAIDFLLDTTPIEGYQPTNEEIQQILQYVNRLPLIYGETIIRTIIGSNCKRIKNVFNIYKRCLQLKFSSTAALEDDE